MPLKNDPIDWQELVSPALSVLVIIGSLAISRFFPEWKADLNFAIINGTVTFTALEMLRRKKQVKNLTERLSKFEKSLEVSTQHKGDILKLAEKLNALGSMSPIVRSVGLYALGQAIEGPKFGEEDDHGIKIRGRELSYKSYIEYWKFLESHAKATPNGTACAYITHASEVGEKISHYHIDKHQKRWCEGGNKIFRIFIDRAADDSGILKYERAMRAMREHAMKGLPAYCMYLKIAAIQYPEALPENCFDHDLCLVNDLRYTAEWLFDEEGTGRVRQFVLSSSSDRYHASTIEWEGVLQATKDVDYSKLAFPVGPRGDEVKTFFQKCKSEFLDAYDAPPKQSHSRPV